MKIKKKAILQRLGMILALTLLFTALAVPVWADGEDGTTQGNGQTQQVDPNADPVVVSYKVLGEDGKELSRLEAGQKCSIQVTLFDSRITDAEPSVSFQVKVGLNSSSSFKTDGATGTVSLQPRSEKGTSVEIRLNDIVYTGGEDNKLSFTLAYEGSNLPMKTVELPITQCVPNTPEPEVKVPEGTPTIVAYTVTDAADREIQRIEPGQKSKIIVAVVDPRITEAGPWSDVKVNIKVTSTTSFASPSLGDIYATSIQMTPNGLKYAIILNDITYRGGDNKLSLDIAYEGYSVPLPLASVEQAISQCYDPGTVEETKESALVLTSASYGGGSVEAGRDFTLTVDVLAPAKYAGAENVKVIITPPEQFTASSGSTMIYVGDLAPGASRQVSFELNASAVAPSGSYSINVSVSGTAANGAAPSDQMSVTVPITQPERFEISRTDLPEYLSMGEEGYAYVSFVNKGKGTIYNVSAEITGEGITTTEGNQYIGNVQSGSESSADFTIQTSQAGNISALLTITYEDEKGNIKELTKDFTITVEEMYMGGGFDDFYPEDFGDMGMMPEENTGIALWVWILIAVGVLAAGGGAAFLIIKKKKAKQKAAQLTEDDDEDI